MGNFTLGARTHRPRVGGWAMTTYYSIQSLWTPVCVAMCVYLFIYVHRPFVHMCAVDVSVSVQSLFIYDVCVYTKAHSFSVTEHTQPVKIIRATGLHNVQATRGDAKAIPNDTALGFVEIQLELKARH